MNKIHNFKSKLVNKEQLAESIYKLEYSVPEDFVFTAGQFVGARVIPTHTRAYSIVNVENNILTLLVDIKPNGIASKYFEAVEVGEETNLLGPYGIYKFKETTLPKVFISTGTGIAPFIAMIKSIKDLNVDYKVYNFFGSKTLAEDISYNHIKKYLNQNLTQINCITREDVTSLKSDSPFREFKSGRVNKVIQEFNFDWDSTEFYICGSEDMINDTSNVLKDLGADKIYIEKY